MKSLPTEVNFKSRFFSTISSILEDADQCFPILYNFFCKYGYHKIAKRLNFFLHILPLYFLSSASILLNRQLQSKIDNDILQRDDASSLRRYAQDVATQLNFFFFQYEDDMRNDLLNYVGKN
jgi:hypothetical protein